MIQQSYKRVSFTGEQPYPKTRSLLDSLLEGGYILYARHAEATVGVDQPNLNFQDCSTQRNLSSTGRRQAIIYGETIRRLRIPILKPIISSPFCRNIETAALAFGLVNIQIDRFWFDVYRLGGIIGDSERLRILNTLNLVLESPPPFRTNKVIIGHNFPEGSGLGNIPDMGTVIVKPLGQGNGYAVIGRLSLEELINLMK
ncbi:histidine phosphatase family protein [Sutcliffiella sp. NC1]|uniref:histidine phosphatase family protein n=1 Tax=Sutcliffiella sp. NC1 TaxID=3004096 RepID=UPI0022DE29B9|nr:histidine phosphatase family protein [Sutcliffiella sp. NC1]WBL16956.1 histidine phosphatase family protein [Sutcliffiella sp. NC1]